MTFIANNPNIISSGNSTTSTLTSSSTFTGTWEDVTLYNSVVVAVKSDQDGTLTVEFSPDGSNIDSSLTRYYRTGQIEPPHRFTITRQYVRIKFTNTSASGQTVMRLQTTYGEKTNLNTPIDSSMSQDYDAIATRPTNFKLEVALGRRQGFSLWNKFGYNQDVDTGGEEIIASFGGTFSRMTTGGTLDVVSTSSADTLAGTGAQQVLIYGVDANWDLQTEIVDMAGLTPVTTSNSWLGVNRVAIYAAGTGETNAGTISITATTGGSTQAEMPAGQGTTQQMLFFVPRNYQGIMDFLLLNALKIGVGTEPTLTIKCYVYSNVAGAVYEVFRYQVDTAIENTFEISPAEPFIVGEKSIVYFTAETDTNNTSINGRFSLILARDVDA